MKKKKKKKIQHIQGDPTEYHCHPYVLLQTIKAVPKLLADFFFRSWSLILIMNFNKIKGKKYCFY